MCVFILFTVRGFIELTSFQSLDLMSMSEWERERERQKEWERDRQKERESNSNGTMKKDWNKRYEREKIQRERGRDETKFIAR